MNWDLIQPQKLAIPPKADYEIERQLLTNEKVVGANAK